MSRNSKKKHVCGLHALPEIEKKLLYLTHCDTLCMFIDRLKLDIVDDGNGQASHEKKLKAAFQAMYKNTVDADGNGKVNFTEFASWIIVSTTDYDEFYQSFVCQKARSEKPPLCAPALLLHSHYAFTLCIHIMHSHYAFTLCIQIMHSHYAFIDVCVRVTQHQCQQRFTCPCRYLEDTVADVPPAPSPASNQSSQAAAVPSIQVKSVAKGATPKKGVVQKHGPLSPRHLTRPETLLDKV